MQKGIATLEVILAVLIIALLMKAAVPNAAKLIDQVALDYETKRLYSELRFLQAVSRSTTAYGTGMGFGIVGDVLSIKFTDTGYQVVRGSGASEATVREPHYLSYGVKISSPKDIVNFDTEKIISNRIELTSRLGKTNKIVFDSVGRIQGD